MDNKAIQKYEETGSDLLATAESMMIVDETTREMAVEFTTKVRAAVRAIEAEFKPDIAKAHEMTRLLKEEE